MFKAKTIMANEAIKLPLPYFSLFVTTSNLSPLAIYIMTD